MYIYICIIKEIICYLYIHMFCPVFTKTCSNGKMLGRIVLGERVLERILNLVVCFLSTRYAISKPYQYSTITLNFISETMSILPAIRTKTHSTVPHIKTYLTNRKRHLTRLQSYQKKTKGHHTTVSNVHI